MKCAITFFALFALVVTVSLIAPAQERPNPAALIAAERDAMVSLAYMDGVWKGPAWTILPSGEKHTITQTERIGPFLDGSVKVIEGRGYDPDGKVTLMLSALFPSTQRQRSTPCTRMRWATSAISC